MLTEKFELDYNEFVSPSYLVREKIQVAIDNLSNEDITSKLSANDRLAIHAFVRYRFAYCKKYDGDKVYTPDVCDPDKVFEYFMKERELDCEKSAIFGYICCVLRDAINDYYRNLEKYRKNKQTSTEDFENSGMSLEEFNEFYAKRAFYPKRLINRTKY